MNLLLGLFILALLLVGIVAICIDINEECDFQTRLAEHEELLDELWGDE